jgi:hypothetical protein
MTTKKLEHGFRTTQCALDDNESQRQLDFRLEKGNALRIVSLWDFRAAPEEERDFQVAMKRRREPAGASLSEMGKKHGL